MARNSPLISWSLSKFKPAAPGTAARNLAKTLMQVLLFWSLFLIAGPLALVALEGLLGVPRFSFPTQSWSPWVPFTLASALGISSGYTMAVHGAGTPLPTDCPRELVVHGPYRYVRNPMAIAGLLQGACVGLLLGSYLTLAYVIAGGLVWDTVVRPLEEVDLEARFGLDFRAYRSSVRCWFPRYRPYEPSGHHGA
jgi:protein-S-isoprenylcysteine O-methyltransferase Ste14